MLVLCFVLSKGTVTLQELIDHAAKTKPVGATVITHSLTKNLRRHVSVCPDARMRLLFAVGRGIVKLRN